MSHVGKEIFEAVPTLTDADPAPAILRIVVMAWIATPLMNVLPDAVCARMGHSMGPVTLRSDFAGETSTRFRVAVTQMRTDDVGRRAAGALTVPEYVLTAGTTILVQYSKSSEGHPWLDDNRWRSSNHGDLIYIFRT